MADDKKSAVIIVKMKPEDVVQLQRLADAHTDGNKSLVVRQLIREAAKKEAKRDP